MLLVGKYKMRRKYHNQYFLFFLSRTSCPYGWLLYQNTYCLKIVSTPMSYDEATNYCESIFAKLLTISTADKLAFIKNDLSENTWLGVKAVDFLDFRWTDNTLLNVKNLNSSWCSSNSYKLSFSKFKN
jgi:hypothetical protein